MDPRIPPSKHDRPFGARSLLFGVLLGIAIVGLNLAASPGRWRVVAYLLAIGVAFIALGVTILRMHRQTRQFLIENDQATAALTRGERTAAHETFRRWAEIARSRRVAALARHNLAWTMAREGAIQDAIVVGADNDFRYRAELVAMRYAATSAVSFALYNACAGDLQNARTWVAEAGRRATAGAPATLPGMRTFVGAIVLCREGQAAEAARLLDDHWTELEATLPGELLRPVRVVRAFALANPRDAGVTEAALASLRPAHSGEYNVLGAAWPEMAAFLASHGLR